MGGGGPLALKEAMVCLVLKRSSLDLSLLEYYWTFLCIKGCRKGGWTTAIEDLGINGLSGFISVWLQAGYNTETVLVPFIDGLDRSRMGAVHPQMLLL